MTIKSVMTPAQLSFWDDISQPLIGRRLFSVVGTLDYDYTEAVVVASPSGDITNENDRVVMSFQNFHASKRDASLHFHVHWEQADATEREFTYQYRVQGNGQAKTTLWSDPIIVSTVGNNKFDYVSGTINQITELGELDITDKGLSCVIQLRWTRSDSNTGAINVSFLDSHVNVDSLGSRQEFVK